MTAASATSERAAWMSARRRFIRLQVLRSERRLLRYPLARRDDARRWPSPVDGPQRRTVAGALEAPSQTRLSCVSSPEPSPPTVFAATLAAPVLASHAPPAQTHPCPARARRLGVRHGGELRGTDPGTGPRAHPGPRADAAPGRRRPPAAHTHPRGPGGPAADGGRLVLPSGRRAHGPLPAPALASGLEPRLGPAQLERQGHDAQQVLGRLVPQGVQALAPPGSEGHL